MLAAEGGSRAGTDCVVLLNIERDLAAPTNATRVTQIKVYWSDQNGNEIGISHNLYTRSERVAHDVDRAARVVQRSNTAG